MLFPITLVLLVILLIYAISYNVSGIWVPDDNYLKEAGLNRLILYVSPEISISKPGYLYIENSDGKVIEDQSIKISIVPFTRLTFPARVSNAETWPKKIKARIDHRHILTIYDDKTILAELYRDNILSAYSEL